MIRTLLSIVVLHLLTNFSHAQQLRPMTIYTHLGEAEGLTTKTIYNIIQDEEGFIWFATDAGVFRYDGNVFKHLTVSDGLTDNEVLNIYQDKKDRIWFLTLNGYLSYWLKGKIYNPENTPYLKTAYLGISIATCFEDSKGYTWFGGIKSGWIRLDSVNSVKTYIWPPEQRTYIHYYQYEDLHDNIWYFYQNQMIRLDKSDTLVVKESAAVFFGCHTEKKSEFIYAAPGGIFKFYDGKHYSIMDSVNATFAKNVINVRSKNDDIWFCTLGEGCYQIKNKKIVNHYLTTNTVTCTIEDREGNLWFSTMGEGVYVIYNNRKSVTNYDNTTGLSAAKIFSITTDNKGTVWVGYKNGIVDRIKNNVVTKYRLSLPGSPEFNRITSLLFSEDTLWCGSDIGIFYIANEQVRFVKSLEARGPGYYSVKEVLKDDQNNVYATFSLNFLKRYKEGNTMMAKQIIDSIFRTFSATALSDGTFLISGMTGIFRFSPGKFFTQLKTDYDFSHERVLHVKTDGDNLILLATNSNGLFIVEREKVIDHYSVKNGLSDNNCRRLCITDSIIYAATGNGLNILKKRNGRWILEGSLTMKVGLLSNAVNDVCVDDKFIYAATDNGLSIFVKNLTQKPLFITSVIPTEIVADKTYYISQSNYKFSVDIPRLLIRFSYPIYNPLNKIKIKYRLIQENDMRQGWIESNNNEVEFSSLIPGKYIFQLSSTSDSLQNAPISNLHIEIKPLWWQTITAKFFYAFALTLFSILIIRKRLKVQYERRLAELRQLTLLESERNRIASDMHDDIGADLTQISIWSNILNTKIRDERDIVSKVAGLSNEVLQKMDQIIWALNSIHNQTTHLVSYLHSYASEYLESADINLKFEVRNEIPELSITAFQRRNIFLVVKELLHNTVKHSGAQNVMICISIDEGRLKIDYADDGKGISDDTKGEGLGMTTLVKRMTEVNSTITFNTKSGSGFSARLDIDIGYKKKNKK